jgi:hypothetical protein
MRLAKRDLAVDDLAVRATINRLRHVVQSLGR